MDALWLLLLVVGGANSVAAQLNDLQTREQQVR